MITKAIIEKKLNEFQYKVRIPIFDRVEDSPEHTAFSDLAVATACMPKGLNNSLEEKDVVFVAFEDNSASQPVIIGQLYREAILSQDKMFLNIEGISVSGQANLPIGTYIGDINIFSYIKQLQEQIDQLNNKINELKVSSEA